ncbi:hypothetical protein [Paenibacillus sanguinis]|uniref:hypothetical protein n=1 Tax=Paenibacillus sanguinis TaxID=225906 RepID=UPI00035E877C|nr:hypothetical protein [Paenibacillus sanguinis]
MEYIGIVALLLVVVLWNRLSNLENQLNTLKEEINSLKWQSGSTTNVNSYAPSSMAAAINPDLEQKLYALIMENQTIRAIKEVRIATGMSLIDAKTYVQDLEQKYRPQR